MNDVVTARASWDPLLSLRAHEGGKEKDKGMGMDKEKKMGMEKGEGEMMVEVEAEDAEEDEEGEDSCHDDGSSNGTSHYSSQHQCTNTNTTKPSRVQASPSITPTSATPPGITTTPTTPTTPTDPTHAPEPEPYHEKQDQWTAFALSLVPITRIFGSHLGPKLAHILVTTAQKQADVLLFGIVNGQESPDLTKLSGVWMGG